MADPTTKEVESIDLAFIRLEDVCAAMSDDQLGELHAIRAQVFGSLQSKVPDDQNLVLNATGVAVREIYLGIVRKREIGPDNDTFHRDRMLTPATQKAYEFGQKLVRWNRLMERHMISRLFGRRGPLSSMPIDEDCQSAISSLSSWLARID